MTVAFFAPCTNILTYLLTSDELTNKSDIHQRTDLHTHRPWTPSSALGDHVTDKYLAAQRYEVPSDWQLFTLDKPETLNLDEQVARLGQRPSLNTHLQEVTIQGHRRTSGQCLTSSDHRPTPCSRLSGALSETRQRRWRAMSSGSVTSCYRAYHKQTDCRSNQTLSYASAWQASDL